MAIQKESEEVVAENLTEFRESLEWKSIEAAKNRKHELELRDKDIAGNLKFKKLEAEAATARLKTSTRSDVWRRAIIGLVKLPALPLAIIFVFVLDLRGHDIPEALESFIDL